MVRTALLLAIAFATVAAASQTTSSVAPYKLTTITGTDPQQGGQPLSNLYNMDQGNGAAEDWNKFMTFQAVYVGHFYFHIPEEAKSGLSGITINSNVMASAYPYQKYKFWVKNQSTGTFVYAGDSKGALEWQFSPININFNQESMSDFYDASGIVVVKFKLAITKYDVYGYMDYMSVNFSYDNAATTTETTTETTTTESTSTETTTTTTNTIVPNPQAVSASVPAHASWSNKAWGWNTGGKDTTDGMRIVDVDLFDTSAEDIASLKNTGHTVICYFSVGTKEDWRDDVKADQATWNSAVVGDMALWDEAWLDVTKLDTLASLMGPRMDLAAEKGCDGVEPDNIDCYDNSECYSPIGTSHEVKLAQIEYNKWQCEYAHNKGLLIAMKNALAIIPDMVAYYDMAMNEECYHWNECGSYQPFFDAGKYVMNVEYQSKASSWCTGRDYADTIMAKWCDGNADSGICQNGDWVNCFDAEDLTGDSSSSTDDSSSSSTDDSSSSSTDDSSSSSTGDSNDVTEPTATETAQVAPYALHTVSGTDPTSGQPLTNLNVHDQGGDAADAWGKFIQFKAYYVGYFDFYVATEARDALSGITLHTNVQSSRHPYQTFNFYLYNHATGAFDWIGDNDDSTDWVWFAFSLDYSSSSMSDYVDGSHSIRVKFELAKDDYDAYGNMDFIAMSFHHSGTGPVSTIVANAVQVTTGDVVTHATCYNEDGSFIRADGACRLNIADLNSDFAGSVQNGAWNPESNKLMFTTFKDGYNDGYPYIRVFDLLTGVTENFGGHLIGVNMPGSTNSWSPDNMLLYAADINYGDEMYCHDYNDKTGTQVLLTKTGTDAWEPSFSADGKWAIFEGGADKILYLTDTSEWHADKEYTPLTSSTRESRQPVWSANGKYITYQAKDSGASDSSFQVMVIDVPDVVSRDNMRYDSATFSERILTDYGTDCSFSPAGDWIVYSGNHHQGAIDAVYVVPVAGGNYVRVTEHDGYDGAPGWSPDGCYIVTESSEYAPGSPPTGVTPRTDLYVIKVPAEVAELTCNVDSSSSGSNDGGVSTGGTNSASEGSTNSDSSSSSSSSNNAGAIVGWFSFGTVSGIILTSMAFVVAILVVKFVRRPRANVATEDDIEAGASAPKTRKMRKGAAQLANDDNGDWDDDAE